LDPATKAAVECTYETSGPGFPRREILKFRRLFQEKFFSPEEMNALAEQSGNVACIFLPEYFEDEKSQELSRKRFSEILTGDADTMLFPSHYRQHDVELEMSPLGKDVDFNLVSLSQEEIDCLAYFTRDAEELAATELFKNGPGTLLGAGGDFRLETATTPDEVRSFLTAFRKMYMTREPGCFAKAGALLAQKVDHPLARWILGELHQYEDALGKPPDLCFGKASKLTFSRKKIVDAYIYTKVVHQPDGKRIKQYEKYLAELGSEDLLTWYALSAAYRLSFHYVKACNAIKPFLDAYLEAKGASPSFGAPPLHVGQGLGVQEKRRAKVDRIFREKVEELAVELWQEAGQPTGGPELFFPEAEQKLRDSLGT